MRITTLILTLFVFAANSNSMAADTEITGFVDASYFRSGAAKNGDFGLDQVEIDITHKASDKSSLRADIEWVRDGDGYVAQIEQGYMSYNFPHDYSIVLGQFNAPIGFELLDAPDMFQFSHSLVFVYGLPTNLTGASLSKNFGRGIDVIGHISNGWDTGTETGKNVTLGGRLGYKHNEFSGGFSAISGKEELTGENIAPMPFERMVLDVDVSWTSGSWLLAGEFNYGEVTMSLIPEVASQDWTGFLVMGHVDFESGVGATLRYDSFDDKGGRIFPLIGGKNQRIQSFTFSPSYVLDESFGALIEVRLDKSDRDGFLDQDGDATNTEFTVALETTYGW